MANQTITLKGKDVGSTNDVDLQYNIGDNQNDVKGYGQPITVKLASDISSEYCRNCDTAWNFIQMLATKHPDIAGLPGFTELQNILKPERHIVSGTFGKEAILHILSQEQCEGIRYMLCEYNNEMSVILSGEKSDKTPIGGPGIFKVDAGRAHSPSDPVLYEVKGGGKSRLQLLEMLEASDQEAKNYNIALFSSFR